jgi:hypothetical protein
MAPKAVPKAKAKAALRPPNGRPCIRGLLGRPAKPVWLRRLDQQYREDTLTSMTTQIVTMGTARHVAEHLLRQSPTEQGRVFHLLALYRNASLRRILREYSIRRGSSWSSVNAAVYGPEDRTRTLVVTRDGILMA